MLLLSGCGAQTQTAQTAPVEDTAALTETEDAAITLAVEKDAGFDPYETLSQCNRLVLELVTQPLFTVSATGEPEPVLAKGWTVSTDGMTAAVYLREDVSFHSGRPLTAADVVASLERAIRGPVYAGRLTFLTEVTAEGQNTVVFHTSKAYECFPRLLDIPIVTGTGEKPIGTGPYMFSGAGLKRSGSWTGQWPTSAETIGFYDVTDSFSLRDGFQYDGVSAAALDPNAPSALSYNGDFELWSVPTSILQYVGFNLTSGPFSDGAVRSAVTYAIDREAVVREDLQGFAVAAGIFALPGSQAESAELSARVAYEPQKLKNVVPKGLTATMIVADPGSQKAKTAQRIANSLTACGIDVTVKALSAGDFRSALEKGDFDLYYAEVKLSPDADFAPFLEELGYGGLDGYRELSALCDLARANSGNAYDLQKVILTDGLLCPVAFKQTALYVHRDTFEGVAPKLNGWNFG